MRWAFASAVSAARSNHVWRPAERRDDGFGGVRSYKDELNAQGRTMTLSHDLGHDDQLVRYLLGLLPGQDAERLDELTVADDEMAWRLRVVENDLVDAYVTGTLTGQRRARFESFYLSSERRRRKVQFARSFLA